MRKKVLSSLIALGLILSTSTAAFADPTVTDLQSQKSQLNDQLSQAQKSEQDIEMKIEELDNNISSLKVEMKKTDDKISQTQSKIDEVQKDIDKAEADIETEQDLYNKRMRALYMSGQDAGYLGVVLESKGLGDFISKIESVKKIAEFDNKLITDLKDKKADVTSKKQVLADEKDKLVDLQNDNNKKLDKLNSDIAAEQPLLAQAKEQVSKSQSQVDVVSKKISDQIAAEKAAQAAADATRQNTNTTSGGTTKSTYVPTRGGAVATASQQAVVNYACSFIGVNYVWGGESPSGFDCSGLMQYTYAHFGISIGRDTYSQINDGRAVSASDLQPGDLVFFGSPSAPHHVGMYVGGGCFVEAPRTGLQVRIASLADRSDFCAARRILN
ncbi:MAG: NlpC/P60 family protein [Bacillota bacterium]|nr:NlpC/P60 family protein [Bacillota bacterium]